jgi:hypothetical protein
MVSRRAGAFLLLLSATVAACTADDLPPEVIRLARFKQKIRQDLSQVPNYTCLEIMERSPRQPRSNSFQLSDTVRLEVSNVDGKELLAWPGARRFEDKNLTTFVTSGLIANGMFALHAHNLFVKDIAAFVYRGEENLNGRGAIRYDYRTPQFLSEYRIRIGGASAMVAIKGSFWFDPVSLDLLRLDASGDEMPTELDLAASVVKIYYSREHIGNSEALLPQRAELMLTFFSGKASRNVVTFSGCREYGSDSTISFEASPEPGREFLHHQDDAAMAQVREVNLAAGLLVPVALETAIVSKTASVGDAVRVRVRQDVRQNGELVLPAGALISGRIRSLDRHSAPAPYFLMGIELSEVEWQNARAEFLGELVDSHDRKAARPGDGTLHIPGVGILHIPGASFHLAPGFRMFWRTLGQQPPSDFR